MNRDAMLREERLFWVQRPNSNAYNDGEYKWRLKNGKVIGVGDKVYVSTPKGNYLATVKQTAGFGLHEDRAVIMVHRGARGKKVHIDDVFDKI